MMMMLVYNTEGGECCEQSKTSLSRGGMILSGRQTTGGRVACTVGFYPPAIRLPVGYHYSWDLVLRGSEMGWSGAKVSVGESYSEPSLLSDWKTVRDCIHCLSISLQPIGTHSGCGLGKTLMQSGKNTVSTDVPSLVLIVHTQAH